MTGTTMYQILGDGWGLCTGDASKAVASPDHSNSKKISADPKEVDRRRRQTREQAARSKTGLWGPTHSYDDSEDNSFKRKTKSNWFSTSGASGSKEETPTTPPPSQSVNQSQGTDSTKSSHSSPRNPAATATAASPQNTNLTPPESSYMKNVWVTAQSALQCQGDTTAPNNNKNVLEYMEDVCSPCQPRNLDSSLAEANDMLAAPALGICRLEPPTCNHSGSSSVVVPKENRGSSGVGERSVSGSSETAADRRRQRHKQRQARVPTPVPPEEYEVTETRVLEPKALPPLSSKPPMQEKVPLESFTLDKNTAFELERSISELTMRSSYGQATAKLAENRRMAYYAVGRNHRQSGRGGNRRCYFTGKLILGGAPFYAGSVQQGLRTLVVFCLPSSIGLPQEPVQREGSVLQSINDSAHTTTSRRQIGVNAYPKAQGSIMSRKGSRISRLSSLDDMSLSVEEELDPNWGLDREYLLKVLPAPNQMLLDEMAKRYPSQFETLPVQVRSHHCWRLYVKFCFFSGLPIAEGELHYKARDDVADLYGEEIVLSHEVMEAVNGDSAEILRLPNLKTFRYLRKHYNQQCGKLPEQVFQRNSWEMVRPEV